MADIIVQCPHCGHACKVSEYVATEEIPCPSCGEAVPIPATPPPSESTQQTSLHLKHDFEAGLVEKKEDGPRKKIKKSHSMEKIHDVKEKARGPQAIWGILTFIIVGGGMLYLLYAKDQNAEYMQYYRWARIGAGVLALALLYLSAFQESHIQGMLTLLIPPYALYYVYVRADSYFVRALFSGLLVALVAEFKYLGDEALLVQMNDIAQGIIHGGEDLIQKASDKPAY